MSIAAVGGRGLASPAFEVEPPAAAAPSAASVLADATARGAATAAATRGLTLKRTESGFIDVPWWDDISVWLGNQEERQRRHTEDDCLNFSNGTSLGPVQTVWVRAVPSPFPCAQRGVRACPCTQHETPAARCRD